MGSKKRKIPMEKIQKKASRAVCFSKRRNGLYSKASELCLLSGAQMAILTTPPFSNSHASFFSFGHSSVDGVVAYFLKNQRPVLGLRFWWEDESLANSENPEELRGAIDSMSTMLKQLHNQRGHQEDLKKKNLVLHETLDQTLNFQSTSATFGINDYSIKTDTEMVAFDDQVLADGDNNQELDLDQLIDFDSLFDGSFETTQEHPETTETSLLMNSEMEDVSMVTKNPNLCFGCDQGVEDGALVLHRGLDEEDLNLL